MAYEDEVRQRARLLNEALNNASSERKRVMSQVDGSRQWWKGKGGEAFYSEYTKIDKDVDLLIKNINNAVCNMGRLPSLIERADRERKK